VPPSPGRGCAPDGLEWNYGELAGRVEMAVDAYTRAGYGHGHRVALLLENRPDFLAACRT
jgi:crotonobetaine/carnitine-CoA ligase